MSTSSRLSGGRQRPRDFIEGLRTAPTDTNRTAKRGEDDLEFKMTSVVKGSIVASLVGAEGFEPPTAGV